MHNVTSKNTSAILEDGRINVSLLEREIRHEISSDAQYKAEDQMKKKAIQMSKDYDEFRNFVACSQLKPVHRTELSQLFQPSNQPTPNHRNSMNKSYSYSSTQQKSYSRDAHDVNLNNTKTKQGEKDRVIPSQKKEKKKKKRHNDKAKKRSVDLHQNLVDKCSSTQTLLCYLISTTKVNPVQNMQNNAMNTEKEESHHHVNIEDEKCYQIVHVLFPNSASYVEIDSGILGKIIEALELCLEILESDDDSDEIRDRFKSLTDIADEENNSSYIIALFIYSWMLVLSKTDRFSINVMFLSQFQTMTLKKIFAFLERQLEVTKSFTSFTNVQANSQVDDKIVEHDDVERYNKLKLVFTQNDVDTLRSLYNA